MVPSLPIAGDIPKSEYELLALRLQFVAGEDGPTAWLAPACVKPPPNMGHSSPPAKVLFDVAPTAGEARTTAKAAITRPTDANVYASHDPPGWQSASLSPFGR